MNVFRVQRKIGWLLSKLKCFFVCVILIVSFFSVSGQGKRVSLRMENVSFMEILTQIERLTDYSFVFKMEDVEKITHLTIQMEDKTVKEVLDACLKDTGLKYLLENNLIIINIILFKYEQKTEFCKNGTFKCFILWSCKSNIHRL